LSGCFASWYCKRNR